MRTQQRLKGPRATNRLVQMAAAFGQFMLVGISARGQFILPSVPARRK